MSARASYIMEKLMQRGDASNPGNSVYTSTISDEL